MRWKDISDQMIPDINYETILTGLHFPPRDAESVEKMRRKDTVQSSYGKRASALSIALVFPHSLTQQIGTHQGTRNNRTERRAKEVGIRKDEY